MEEKTKGCFWDGSDMFPEDKKQLMHDVLE